MDRRSHAWPSCYRMNPLPPNKIADIAQEVARMQDSYEEREKITVES